MSAAAPTFDERFRAELATLFRWRRDVRRFRPDPVADEVVLRLLGLCRLAPSVGLSEPWRLVIVEDPARRQAVRACFEAADAAALAGYGGARRDAYRRLKLAGLDEAPCHFAAFADRETEQGHGLGRSTMPEMADYSVVMAVHSMWLAARAEGLGLGWVSILDPDRVAEVLDVPPSWRLIGYFCLGYPAEETPVPELERAEWEHRREPVVIRR